MVHLFTCFEVVLKTVSSKYYVETVLQTTSLWPAEEVS